MENAHCIICSKEDSISYITVNDRLSKTSNKYNLFQCTCGFIYLHPRPKIEEMNQYYQSKGYDPHSQLSNGTWSRVYHSMQRLALIWKYKIIRRYNSIGSLLDIGGGKGVFAEFIHSKGWDVTFQDSFAKLDEKVYGSSFVPKLKDINPSTKFDVITLWHSLEHIHNIKDLFDFLHSSLKDSGILMIAVPNLKAPERNYYKENWAPYDAPRHLYHFNLNRLNELCRKNGYDIIHKYSLIQDLPYNVILSMPSYTFFQIIKAICVIFYSLLYILCKGPEYASSVLIVCRKSH